MITVYTMARTIEGLDAPQALRSTRLSELAECLVDASSAWWDGVVPDPGQTVRGVVRWRSRGLQLPMTVPDMHIAAYVRAEDVETHAERLARLAADATAARADLRAAVVEANVAGVSEREITRTTGLARNTVRAWLAQYGSGGATGGGGSPRSI